MSVFASLGRAFQTTRVWINQIMRKVICGTLLLALISNIGYAKGGETLWENLQRIKVGQTVDVVEMNSSVMSGKFKNFSREGISIEAGNRLIEINRSDVRSVNVRKSKVNHIAIGAGVGAALGVALSGGGGKEGVPVLLTPISIGTAAGIGALLPSHSEIYEHPCVSQGNCQAASQAK